MLVDDIIKKFKDSHPTANRVKLVELSLSGLLTGEEFLMGSPDVVGHPLYNRNMDNPLIQKILDDSEVRFVIGNQSGQSSVTGATSSGKLPSAILERKVNGALQFAESTAVDVKSGQSSALNDFLQARLVIDSSARLKWLSEYHYENGSKMDFVLYTLDPNSKSYFIDATWPQGRVVGSGRAHPQTLVNGKLENASAGWYSEITGIDLSPLGEVDTSLGYYCTFATTEFKAPRIPGKRYVATLVPSKDSSRFNYIGGYVSGEGPMTLHYDVSGYYPTGIIYDAS